MIAWSPLGACRSSNFLHEMSVSPVKQLPGQAWPCKLHTGCAAIQQLAIILLQLAYGFSV